MSHPTAGCMVCIGRGRGRNQFFQEHNEGIQPSESNTNKTSPSGAFLVGVRIVHKWPSVCRFRILSVDYVLGSAVSAVPRLSPTQTFPPSLTACFFLDWNSDRKPAEPWIGRKMPPFHSGRSTQIFCVCRMTILFLCLIKLHSEHSIIKTRPEFMNKRSIYYIGQRKDKLYAWKVSLSWDSHKPTCWQGRRVVFFLIFLAPQHLNQSYKIRI